MPSEKTVDSTEKTKIALHGVPRSGTTWLGEILNSSANVLYKYQPLFSYELKGFLNEHSGNRDIISFFNKLQMTESAFLDQTDARASEISPTFKKDRITHIVYKEVRYHHILKNLMLNNDEIKVIGIIRNPLAVLNSWLNAPREFRKDLGWDETEEWRFAHKKNQNRPEEFFGFEKWKDAANIFHELVKLYPTRFKLVRYDQLINDTMNQVTELFEFCDLELTAQTKDFLEKSTSVNKIHTYSVYKTKITDDEWKNSLSDKIISAVLTDLKNSPLNIYL